MKKKLKVKEMSNNIDLNITLSNDEWENKLDNLEEYSQKVIDLSISFVKKIEEIEFLNLNKKIYVDLCLSNNKEVQELNREFRGKDKATNVLSFANIDDDEFYNDIELFEDIQLGSIILAFETVEDEAKEKNIPFINHYTHLLIHGILHLLGFDHIEDDEAEYMEETEVNILKEFNIDNPYTE